MGSGEVTHKFWERQALSISSGEIGVRNPMLTAQECHDTSPYACSVPESLVDGKKLDLKAHHNQIGKAISSYQKCQIMREATWIDMSGHHHPAKLQRWKRAMCTGAFLAGLPYLLNGNILSAEEFQDNICLREGPTPLNLPSACDGCGKHFDVEHALTCKKGDLVHIWHGNGAEEEFAQLLLSHS